MFHCRRKDPVIDEVVRGRAVVMRDLPVEQDSPFNQLMERLNRSDKQHFRSGCGFATCHDAVAHLNLFVAPVRAPLFDAGTRRLVLCHKFCPVLDTDVTNSEILL